MPRRGRSRNAKNKRRRADDGDDYADEEDLSDICEQERRAQPPRKAKVRLLEDDVGFTTSAPKPRQTARTSTKGPAPKANTRLKSIKATTTKATKATSSRVTDSLEVSDASDASIASDSSDASDVFRPQRPTTANAATTTSSIEQAIKRLGISDSVLATAWKVNPKMVKKRLHFVFDAVAPYVEFKWGARFSMDKDFPERGDVTPSELTDSQGDGYVKEWMAYAPRDYRPRYTFKSIVTPESFMHWERGELRSFDVGTPGATAAQWRTYKILAPYERIIAQLALEAEHGEKHLSHEPRRRREYANRVLDLFGDEIKSFSGDPSAFFSAVLSPILIRQFMGVHDDLSETVRAVVAKGEESATADDVVEFYLKADPTDPSYIPFYRRQLLNMPIARWHLAVVLGLIRMAHTRHYHRFYNDHVLIMESLTYDELDPETNIPLLNKTDMAAIAAERLEGFFRQELGLVSQSDFKEILDLHRPNQGKNLTRETVIPITIEVANSVSPLSPPTATRRTRRVKDAPIAQKTDTEADTIPAPKDGKATTERDEAEEASTSIGQVAHSPKADSDAAMDDISVHHDEAERPSVHASHSDEASKDIIMSDVTGDGAVQSQSTSSAEAPGSQAAGVDDGATTTTVTAEETALSSSAVSRIMAQASDDLATALQSSQAVSDDSDVPEKDVAGESITDKSDTMTDPSQPTLASS